MKLVENTSILKYNDVVLIKYSNGTVSVEKILFQDEDGDVFDFRTITLYTNNWEIKEWLERNPGSGGEGLLRIDGDGETVYLLDKDEIKNAIIFEGVL